MKPCYLFVYGTLHSDCGAAQAELIQQHFTLAGQGVAQGQLYEINGYPGLVLSANPGHAVQGELYELTGSAAAFEQLDICEGCTEENPKPHEYRRREVPVKRPQGGSVMAWVYLYNWPLAGYRNPGKGNYAALFGDSRPN